MELFYSFIIPVYNRPGELEELLTSMCVLTHKNFEVIIVEDGSDLKSGFLVEKFSGQLNIRYHELPRSGPSRARNAGTRAAKGDYFIYVDSDCILPPEYLSQVDRFLSANPVDFFGGPDRASENFNFTQKAISYAMTSFLTTGGIRGGKKKVDRFYPRSFNMGISRKGFETVGGYPETRMHPGEDMVLSIELVKRGFPSALIPEAYVFHKRRTSLGKFFKQVFGFGNTRYIISKVYPETFNPIFLLPSLFLIGSVFLVFLAIAINYLFIIPLLAWILLVYSDATIRNHSRTTGLIAVVASFIQLFGYGTGFLKAWLDVGIRRKDQYGVFVNGFYPDRTKTPQSH